MGQVFFFFFFLLKFVFKACAFIIIFPKFIELCTWQQDAGMVELIFEKGWKSLLQNYASKY